MINKNRFYGSLMIAIFVIIVFSSIKSNSYSPYINDITIKVDFKKKIDTIAFSKNMDRDITLTIENKSSEDIEIINIPDLNIVMKIEKKVGDHYIAMDSECVVIKEPMMIEGGVRFVKLRANKKLVIPEVFPPFCTLHNKGDYKVKFLFGYKVNALLKEIETEWYSFYVAQTL